MDLLEIKITLKSTPFGGRSNHCIDESTAQELLELAFNSISMECTSSGQIESDTVNISWGDWKEAENV